MKPIIEEIIKEIKWKAKRFENNPFEKYSGHQVEEMLKDLIEVIEDIGADNV